MDYSWYKCPRWGKRDFNLHKRRQNNTSCVPWQLRKSKEQSDLKKNIPLVTAGFSWNNWNSNYQRGWATHSHPHQQHHCTSLLHVWDLLSVSSSFMLPLFLKWSSNSSQHRRLFSGWKPTGWQCCISLHVFCHPRLIMGNLGKCWVLGLELQQHALLLPL